jgi:hypothetical protein
VARQGRARSREVLDEVGRQVRERGFDGSNPVEPIYVAIACGAPGTRPRHITPLLPRVPSEQPRVCGVSPRACAAPARPCRARAVAGGAGSGAGITEGLTYGTGDLWYAGGR